MRFKGAIQPLHFNLTILCNITCVSLSRITVIMWTAPTAIPRRTRVAPHPSKARRIKVNYRNSTCVAAALCHGRKHYNHQMFPRRLGSRQPHIFQLQPLQSPLTSAGQVPQVPAARQGGEQGEESAGGPAAAGTRGKQEGVTFPLSQELCSFSQ